MVRILLITLYPFLIHQYVTIPSKSSLVIPLKMHIFSSSPYGPLVHYKPRLICLISSPHPLTESCWQWDFLHTHTHKVHIIILRISLWKHGVTVLFFFVAGIFVGGGCLIWTEDLSPEVKYRRPERLSVFRVVEFKSVDTPLKSVRHNLNCYDLLLVYCWPCKYAQKKHSNFAVVNHPVKTPL